MTNEPILERVKQLEQQVRTWRRTSLVLALLLICGLAVGGTLVGSLTTEVPGRFDWMMLLPWVRAERAAREEALRARLEQAARAAAEKEREKGAAPAGGVANKKEP